jgi:hypothetical protein
MKTKSLRGQSDRVGHRRKALKKYKKPHLSGLLYKESNPVKLLTLMAIKLITKMNMNTLETSQNSK